MKRWFVVPIVVAIGAFGLTGCSKGIKSGTFQYNETTGPTTVTVTITSNVSHAVILSDDDYRPTVTYHYDIVGEKTTVRGGECVPIDIVETSLDKPLNDNWAVAEANDEGNPWGDQWPHPNRDPDILDVFTSELEGMQRSWTTARPCVDHVQVTATQQGTLEFFGLTALRNSIVGEPCFIPTPDIPTLGNEIDNSFDAPGNENWATIAVADDKDDNVDCTRS